LISCNSWRFLQYLPSVTATAIRELLRRFSQGHGRAAAALSRIEHLYVAVIGGGASGMAAA
jgi:hypothetical protein